MASEATSKRNQKRRPALKERKNPPTPPQQVTAALFTEFEVATNSDEMILESGKRHLTDAVESTEVTRLHDSTVVCNPGGRSLMAQLQDLTSKVSEFDAKYSAQIADLKAEHSAQIADLKAEHSARIADLEGKYTSLLPFKNYFLDVRERAYLTHLRNYWRDYGASRQKNRSPSKIASGIQVRINSLNTNVLHGGNVEVDALMFLERHPVEGNEAFLWLYGLEPDQIKILASKGYRSILNMLNAAGAVHYENHHMEKNKQEVFDKVIKLVRDGKLADANQAATEFPFAADFIAPDAVMLMDEDED